MKRPVVGVIGNTRLVEDRFTAQMVGETNLRAVADVAGALPMMFAGTPDITDLGALLEVAGEKARPVAVPDEAPIDDTWAEPPAFDGCATRGQARPGDPQPVHIVRAATQRGVQA